MKIGSSLREKMREKEINEQLNQILLEIKNPF